MKKIVPVFFIIAFFTLIGCAGAPKFSDVSGKDWKLVQVKVAHRDTHFDRKTLIEHGVPNLFILNFDASNISGTAAPNKYNAPYTLGDPKARAIKINPMRSTQMAMIYEPEKLKEAQFFIYMQNVYEWNIVDKRLHLKSKVPKEGGGETEVELIFAL
jgi:heat shock protein HslJ